MVIYLNFFAAIISSLKTDNTRWGQIRECDGLCEIGRAFLFDSMVQTVEQGYVIFFVHRYTLFETIYEYYTTRPSIWLNTL